MSVLRTENVLMGILGAGRSIVASLGRWEVCVLVPPWTSGSTERGYCTVIPRLTSDPANEFFRLTKIFFAVFLDSANEYGFG